MDVLLPILGNGNRGIFVSEMTDLWKIITGHFPLMCAQTVSKGSGLGRTASSGDRAEISEEREGLLLMCARLLSHTNHVLGFLESRLCQGCHV